MRKILSIVKFFPFFFLSFWLFKPILNYEFLNYDDPRFIHDHLSIYIGNPSDLLKWAFTNHVESYWVPGAWILHAMNVKLYGLWAGGHHLTSVLGHVLNAILITSIVEKLTQNQIKALFVGLFFLIHPIHIETVYWCTAIRDIYASCFTLLAIRLHLEETNNPLLKIMYRFLEISFFLLACMFKPFVLFLPILLFALNLLLRPKIKINKLKFFCYGVIVFFIFFMNLWARSKYVGDFDQPVRYFSTYRYFNALQMPVLLGMKFFLPIDLSLIYPRGIIYSLTLLLSGLSFLYGMSVFVFIKRKVKPLLAFGWLWFLMFIFFPIYLVSSVLMADRYIYLPSVGLFLILIALIDWIRERSGLKIQRILYGVLILYFLFFLVEHRSYAKNWQNSKILFQHSVSVNPNNAVALNQLGLELFKEGNYFDAFKSFEAAIHVSRQKDVRSFDMKHLKNLSASLAATGKLNQALEILKLIYTEDSQDPYELNELGIIYDLNGDYLAAERVFLKTLLIDPLNEVALLKLSAIYIKQCNAEKGTDTVHKLIAIQGKFRKHAEQLMHLIDRIRRSTEEEIKQFCLSSPENNSVSKA